MLLQSRHRASISSDDLAMIDIFNKYGGLQSHNRASIQYDGFFMRCLIGPDGLQSHHRASISYDSDSAGEEAGEETAVAIPSSGFHLL